MTDSYGRPYRNPTDKANADALARRYANGELPTTIAPVVQDIADLPEESDDPKERVAAIVEKILKDEERERQEEKENRRVW